MWLIIVFIVAGVFLLLVELVLTPGVSVALIGAVASFGTAIYLGFTDYGLGGGVAVCVVLAVIAVGTVVMALRAKTWRKLALKSEITGSSQQKAEDTDVVVGQRGRALTRLAPMGKVVVGGNTYEAKSADEYIDQKSEIEVVGFENFSLVVRKC